MTQQKAALSVGCCRGEWTGCVGSGLSQAAWCASSCCWWLCFLLLAKSCPLAAAVFSLDPPVSCCLLGSFGSPTALCPFPWDTKLPLAPWKGRVGAASCQHPPLMPLSGLFKNLLWSICASTTLENKLPAVFFFHSVSSKMKFWELSAE